ncbi:hypothetical protein NMYAN_60024 [Nitrosomonas nitrosa]|uniref:Uncharacterized protein n=1 Tax=Nitrosomonas nitrosa TaxID=52442 RepID=A0A8H8Z2R1_9PROT|nr:hypothetical protein NMYAN_60024 [Nitrosomonas nitrosa]
MTKNKNNGQQAELRIVVPDKELNI